jgi:hypothetical protein
MDPPDLDPQQCHILYKAAMKRSMRRTEPQNISEIMTHSISDDDFAVLYITFCVARQPDCIMHTKNHTL